MKVRVNPTYSSEGWYDPKSGVNFFKRDKEVVIPEGRDLTNIKRYINLNYLILIEDEVVEVEPDFIYQTPNQLLAEEETVEVEEEIIVETFEEVESIVGEVQTEEEEKSNEEKVQEEEEVVNPLDCQYCGKTLKSASGKTTHEKACKENPNK